MPTMDFWSVARVWYVDRFDPEWAPRSRERAQEIFAGAGLAGAFWTLPGAE